MFANSAQITTDACRVVLLDTPSSSGICVVIGGGAVVFTDAAVTVSLPSSSPVTRIV